MLVTSHNILRFLYLNVIDFPGQDPGLIILRIIKTRFFLFLFFCFFCFFLRGVYCISWLPKKTFLKKLVLGSLEFLPGESQGREEPGRLPSMGSHRAEHD